MIDVEIVEDDAVEIVDERPIAEGEATTDESSDRVLTSEELTIIAEPPLGRMFVEKVFTVVSVAVAATAVLVVIETEVSMFHPIPLPPSPSQSNLWSRSLSLLSSP